MKITCLNKLYELKFCEVYEILFQTGDEVSAFYLEKQKKGFIPKKKKNSSHTAKVDPKDGVSCPNCQ